MAEHWTHIPLLKYSPGRVLYYKKKTLLKSVIHNSCTPLVSQSIKDTLDKKQILTAVFVDFQSAYDKVCKQNLLLKLARQGIKSKLLSWLESFLSQRSCRVKYGEEYSKNKILQTGLPQGAVTSCTLFNIYINDLLDELDSIPT